MKNEVWSVVKTFLNELRCENTGRKTFLNQPEYQCAVMEKMQYYGLVGETEKFEAGQTYSAYVAVYPKDGFFINVTEEGRKAFLGSSRVNGMTPYVGGPFSGWTADGSEFIFQVDLTVKEKTPTVINRVFYCSSQNGKNYYERFTEVCSRKEVYFRKSSGWD